MAKSEVDMTESERDMTESEVDMSKSEVDMSEIRQITCSAPVNIAVIKYCKYIISSLTNYTTFSLTLCNNEYL